MPCCLAHDLEGPQEKDIPRMMLYVVQGGSKATASNRPDSMRKYIHDRTHNFVKSNSSEKEMSRDGPTTIPRAAIAFEILLDPTKISMNSKLKASGLEIFQRIPLLVEGITLHRRRRTVPLLHNQKHAALYKPPSFGNLCRGSFQPLKVEW